MRLTPMLCFAIVAALSATIPATALRGARVHLRSVQAPTVAPLSVVPVTVAPAAVVVPAPAPAPAPLAATPPSALLPADAKLFGLTDATTCALELGFSPKPLTLASRPAISNLHRNTYHTEWVQVIVPGAPLVNTTLPAALNGIANVSIWYKFSSNKTLEQRFSAAASVAGEPVQWTIFKGSLMTTQTGVFKFGQTSWPAKKEKWCSTGTSGFSSLGGGAWGAGSVVDGSEGVSAPTDFVGLGNFLAQDMGSCGSLHLPGGGGVVNLPNLKNFLYLRDPKNSLTPEPTNCPVSATVDLLTYSTGSTNQLKALGRKVFEMATAAELKHNLATVKRERDDVTVAVEGSASALVQALEQTDVLKGFKIPFQTTPPPPTMDPHYPQWHIEEQSKWGPPWRPTMAPPQPPSWFPKESLALRVFFFGPEAVETAHHFVEAAKDCGSHEHAIFPMSVAKLGEAVWPSEKELQKFPLCNGTHRLGYNPGGHAHSVTRRGASSMDIASKALHMANTLKYNMDEMKDSLGRASFAHFRTLGINAVTVAPVRASGPIPPPPDVEEKIPLLDPGLR